MHKPAYEIKLSAKNRVRIKIIICITVALQINLYSQITGSINGIVRVLSNHEPIVYASVKILNTKFESRTDFDGKFILKDIPVGIYQLEASGHGYNQIRLENIKVETDKGTTVLFELSDNYFENIHGVLDSANISFSYMSLGDKPAALDSIIIEYKDSIFNYYINNRDFFIDEYLGQPHTNNYETCTSGFLSVSFKLMRFGKTISHGKFSLPLEKDWNIRIDFYIADENPMNSCFGCRGYKIFPIEGEFKKSENDCLYIIWGGNFIEHPVIY